MTMRTPNRDRQRRSLSPSAYVAIVLSVPLITLAAVMFVGFFHPSPLKARDHFGQISLNGDDRWYMNFANLLTQEMQDRDILYHGIGQSIEHLKQADIVILGHSVLEFGIDNEQIEQFERRYGVKVYNLNNPGIASGQYIRRLIEKWHLKPKLWIINADDYPGEFFDPQMDDYFASGRNSVFRIVDAGYSTSYISVASRNIRWRLELWLSENLPPELAKNLHLSPVAAKTWRNIENGNFYADLADGYIHPGKPLQKRREGGCPLAPDLPQRAGRYISSLGGSVVFTLLPYEGWCPEYATELAAAIGVEAIVPEHPDFELLDGRHMNKTGARAFTRYLLDHLSQTYAFKTMVGDPNPGLPPQPGSARVSLPVDLCIRNDGPDRMFASLRGENGVSDHPIEAGSQLKAQGFTFDLVCTSTKPFGRDECPNSKYQSAFKCH